MGDGSEIPNVVFDLADVLPQFEGADLESQLQSFDVFLESLAPLHRPAIVEILRKAASKTHNATSRRRIEAAAESVAGGGRAAAAYDHQEAMQTYRAQHAANFAPKSGSISGRKVDEQEYTRVIEEADAVMDPKLPRRNMGEVERWIRADGAVVAWLIVRYFKGEEDYDYYVGG